MSTTEKSIPTPTTGKELFIPISQIKQELFVREELDDDRIWYWAQKFENDPNSVAAIEITQHDSLTDGRHRIAGALLAEKTEIKCYVFPVKNRAEQIKRAFLANVAKDSPKPPTKGDTVYAIKQMMDENMKKSEIMDTVCKMFPLSTCKELYNEARRGIDRDNLRNAKRAVLDDGKTVATAAVQFDVDPEKLREELGGSKKKKKVTNTGEIKSLLSVQYRSNGQKIRAIFAKVEKVYEEGDISKENFLGIYDYGIASLEQRLRDLKDKKARLESKN